MKIIWWFWKREIHKEFLEDYIFFASLKLCSIIELCSNVRVVLFNKAFRLKSNFKIRALLYSRAFMLESSTYLRALLYSRAFTLELDTYLHIKLVTDIFQYSIRYFNHFCAFRKFWKIEVDRYILRFKKHFYFFILEMLITITIESDKYSICKKIQF